jgi:anti-sigma factor ChrR (cupin superfamily)
MSSRPQGGCERTERVAEYALQAMPLSERLSFEAHVGECPDCRQELAAVRPIVDAFVDWPTDILKPPAPLWERLAERVAADSGVAPSLQLDAGWPDEPEWKEVAPGISCKLLSTDAETERVSMLVRLQPDVAYPAHTHAGVEELHLLDGELWIEDRKLHPGDYNRAEPGTGDTRVWTETGCTCLLMTSFRDVLR